MRESPAARESVRGNRVREDQPFTKVEVDRKRDDRLQSKRVVRFGGFWFGLWNGGIDETDEIEAEDVS